MKTIVKLFLLFFLICSTVSAKLVVLDYYTLRESTNVNFIVLDDSNRIVPTLDKSEIAIFENNIKVSDFNFQNIIQPQYSSSNIVFLYDLSIGNVYSDNKKISLDIIQEVIKLSDNSLKALIGFDFDNYLFCNFTTDTTKLFSSLQYLRGKPSAGSNFDTAFVGSNLGALNFLPPSSQKKNIVLITDKNRTFDFDEIQTLSTQNNVSIFIIAINFTPNSKFYDLVRKTNGYIFKISNIEDFAYLNNILDFLFTSGKPAELNWQNLPLCTQNRLIQINLKKQLEFEFESIVENTNFPQIIAYPPYLRFSYVIPSNSKELELTLVARNFDIRVDSLQLQDTHFKIVSGNITMPTIIPKDSAHKIIIKFTPTDSSIVFDSLVIFSNACEIRKVNITGGFPNKKPKTKTLSILSPKCDEYFFIGDTIHIRWEGVLPTDVVQLQYSTNGGNGWDTLAVNVLGLEYNFYLNPVKFQESDSCLIRVIQIWPNNAGETIELRHQSSINSANFNRDASLIVTSANHPEEFASVWNPGTGRKLFQLRGHSKPVNWACFDLQDRYILTASDDSTSILYDIKTGDSLYTFKAHKSKVTSANFSPDGNYILSSGTDGKCFIWDLRNKNLVHTISTGINPIYFANFTPDTNHIAYASYDGNIYLYDIRQLKVVKTFITKFSNNHIHHFSIQPETKKLAAATHLGLLFIFNYDLEDTLSKVYPSYVLSHDSISFPAINTAYFNSNGNWLITAGSDARVLRWNPSTGELIDSIAIAEHSNSITTAQFSFDDAMLLTSSWDSTAKIFNRTKLGLQIDTTDCLFSIVHPQVASFDVDFGSVFLGQSKDTLVRTILINNSRYRIDIKQLTISNDQLNEFSILNKFEHIFLNPGDTLSLLLNFAPADTGLRQANIVFEYPGGNAKVKLYGSGISAPISLKPNYINIGEVDIGEFKDTLLKYIILNRSSKPINLLTVRNIGPDSLFFSIIDGGETTVIQPNNYHPITIRFTPDSLGKRNTLIEFATDSEIPKLHMNILGEGVFPTYDSLTISVGNYEARTGQTIKIPITIKNKYFTNTNSTYNGIGFDFIFNKTILEPLDKNFPSRTENDFRILKVQAQKELLSDSILIELHFRVGLGNDSSSPLIIANSFPLGRGKIVIKEESGSLKITDLCKEGGIRLFEPDGKITIGPIEPNPSNGITRIEFETIEQGRTKLELYDYAGNLTKVLLDEHLKPSKYFISFDASSLESGIYLLILRTPNLIKAKMLQVVK